MEQHIQDKEEEHMESEESDAEEEQRAARLDERSFEDYNKVMTEQAASASATTEDPNAYDDQSDLLADLPDDTSELELAHSRIKSLNGLPLARFAPTLKKLCLRQNLITSLVYKAQETDEQEEAILEHLTELEDLDLYDNKLSLIQGISNLSKLRTLDLSFNLIKKLPKQVFDSLHSLRTLYVIQNRISRIDGLDGLATSLVSLELGGNKIRTIENLTSLTNLTELWLGKNKITTLQGMEALVNLRILSIQSNRVTEITSLDTLVNLEEFYISHNGLTALSGLNNLNKLRVLDVGANQIAKLENIAHLTELEEFWANDNQLNSIADVQQQLSGCAQLETVYLEGNPLQRTLATTYRRKLMDILPQVKQIDATFTKQG